MDPMRSNALVVKFDGQEYTKKKLSTSIIPSNADRPDTDREEKKAF